MHIIGDIHGCYKTLNKLLDKLDLDKGVVFVGDLIDRGPESAHVVSLVRQMCLKPNIHCVKGNHEDMMALAVLKDRSKVTWMANGGDTTIQSYTVKYRDKYKEIMRKDAEWMESLPTYLELPIQVNSKDVVISHSCCTTLWEQKDSNRQYFDRNAMWSRFNPEHYMDKTKFNIFGHTILTEPKIKDQHANIDTGAFLGLGNWKSHAEEGHGKLTALELPSLNVVQQDCVD